ncbi:hypothetical protein [Actinoplanes sp. NPDC026623]|uniref:hypothetical protein n=1 Tax=Actinoplanes sp. NPDC026623 TaxID=3155610 RepID=UPI0033EEBD1F
MEGWQFAAELSQLRIVGRVDLPELSFTYASMNQAVNGTAGGEAAAFQAPDGGTASSQVVWSALRDEIQNVFGRTAIGMLDAGVVMEHIVDAYSATDDAARTSLESAWANGQTPSLQEAENTFSQSVPPPVVIKDAGV